MTHLRQRCLKNTLRSLVLNAWIGATFGILYFGICNTAFAQNDPDAGSDASAIRSLVPIWDSHRKALSIIEVQYRSVRRKVPDGHNVNPDKARNLMRKLSRNDEPEVLAEVAVALDPRLKGEAPPWSVESFILHGDSYRSSGTHPGGVSKWLRVNHDGYEVHVRERQGGPFARQVSILLTQKKLIRGPRELSDFVVFPPNQFLNGAQVSHVKVPGAEDRLSIAKNHSEFIVDAKTGFVHEHKRGKMGARNYHETVQFPSPPQESGLVVPALYFKSRYSEKRLTSFSLRLIDELKVHPKELPEWFQVPVSQEDLVIDQTGGKGNRKMIDVSQPSGNVLDLLEDKSVLKVPLPN